MQVHVSTETRKRRSEVFGWCRYVRPIFIVNTVRNFSIAFW